MHYSAAVDRLLSPIQDRCEELGRFHKWVERARKQKLNYDAMT